MDSETDEDEDAPRSIPEWIDAAGLEDEPHRFARRMEELTGDESAYVPWLTEREETELVTWNAGVKLAAQQVINIMKETRAQSRGSPPRQQRPPPSATAR